MKNLLKYIYKYYKKINSIKNLIYNNSIFKIQKVKYSNNLKIDGKIFLRNNGLLIIGENVKINSSLRSNPITGDNKSIIYTVNKNSKISIGNNVGLSNCVIHCKDEINIHENVLIGCGVKIYDHDFHSINIEDRIREHTTGISKEKSAKINIHKGAFIGANSIILKGVTIGENSVIGAGSVIRSNVPPNEIWGGNPAICIKKIKKYKEI